MVDDDNSGRRQLFAVAAEIREHLAFEAKLGTVGVFPGTSLDTVRGPEVSQPRVAVDRDMGPSAGRAESVAKGPSVNVRGRGQIVADESPAIPTGTGIQEAQTKPQSARVACLAMLAERAAACTACGLHEQRKKSVFARGDSSAELVFVGEGPGRDEDLRGLPFVGAAGQLLDRMIGAMGFGQEEVYICNVVKCRPPQNRTPSPEEAKACSEFLIPQIEQIAPKVIVALGRCAAENLGVAPPQGGWRGRWSKYRGVPVMPTYHPAFLLRSPEFKKVVWQDLQLVMGRLGRTRST